MTAPVKDTVNVNITNQTPRITEVGFGTILMIGKPVHLADRTKLYAEASELLEDGYLPTDEVYKKALILMGQERTPVMFMVGKRNKNANTKQKIVFSDNPTDGTFTIEVDGQTTAAIAFGADAAAIKTALELLSTVNVVNVVRVSGTEITIEFVGTDENTLVELVEVYTESLVPALTTSEVTYLVYGAADEDAILAYEAIKASNNEFYGVIFTSDAVNDAEAEALIGVIQTEERHCSFIRSTALIASTNYAAASDELATNLKVKNFDKCHVIFTKHADNYLDAAIMGLQLTKTPGSSSFMYKTLIGVKTDTLSTTERANLRSKSCNYYESQSGKPVFKDGVVPSGEFIDIVIGIDFLTVRMGETVFIGISTPEKLDYGRDGVDVVENLMLTSLFNFGVENNLIFGESIVIIMPDVTTVPIQDKANRILKNCKFSALLRGAIHYVNIDGTLTV